MIYEVEMELREKRPSSLCLMGLTDDYRVAHHR